jgi:hypothetical protein
LDALGVPKSKDEPQTLLPPADNKWSVWTNDGVVYPIEDEVEEGAEVEILTEETAAAIEFVEDFAPLLIVSHAQFSYGFFLSPLYIYTTRVCAILLCILALHNSALHSALHSCSALFCPAFCSAFSALHSALLCVLLCIILLCILLCVLLYILHCILLCSAFCCAFCSAFCCAFCSAFCCAFCPAFCSASFCPAFYSLFCSAFCCIVLHCILLCVLPCILLHCSALHSALHYALHSAASFCPAFCTLHSALQSALHSAPFYPALFLVSPSAVLCLIVLLHHSYPLFSLHYSSDCGSAVQRQEHLRAVRIPRSTRIQH